MDYRKVYVLFIIVALAIFLAWSLSGFLTSFLGAVILYVLLKPLLRYMTVEKRWNKPLCVLIAMVITFITVLVPVWLLYGLLSSKINYAITHSADLISGLKAMDLYVAEHTGIKILSTDMLQKIQELAANIIPQILGATADMLATIGMMYFMLYYMLINLGKGEKILENLLPVRGEKTLAFKKELEAAVFSNVMGAPVLAILQGLVAGAGYWILGLDEPWFWGAITGFMSFIPLVGTALIWIPAGIYQLVNAENWQGAGILIFGALVITNIDNVFRFALQKRFADVHPMITVLGVIVGLRWFGITGIVFGPLMISYFLMMARLYQDEYSR